MTLPPIAGSPLRDWAVVGFKDDTGLGRLAEDFIGTLGIGHHLVTPSEKLPQHPLQAGRDRPLAPDVPKEGLAPLLAGLKGIILLERCTWHESLAAEARRLGLTVVGLPMWEWFNGRHPAWRSCSLIACVNAMTERIVRRYGFEATRQLPVPFSKEGLPSRSIRGPARTFFHNAGIVDQGDRKGTRETILAFKRARLPAARLIVRMQKPADLPELDGRIEVRVGNLPDRAALYAEGECAIQPSKMEGIGFNIIEPVVCGIPTITLDYPPMSEWMPEVRLLVAKRWFKRRAFPSHWIPHAHQRLPRIGDLVRRIEWAGSHDLAEIATSGRERLNARFDPARVRAEWHAALGC
jgi:hypothetical protein